MIRSGILMFITVMPVLLIACGGDDGGSSEPTLPVESPPPAFALTSTAFSEGEAIPSRFTCDGEDVSPALAWDGIPEEARSFAVIMEDPDAPGGVYTHWVLYGLGAEVRSLPEGVETAERPSTGGAHGTNDFGEAGYGGPCPPAGNAHRYEFRLYVLDNAVDLAPGAGKEQVLAAMKGHILGLTRLTGTYARAQ